MNQSELVRHLAEQNNSLTMKEVRLAVLGLVSQIEAALADDGRIEIRGFGVLQSRRKPPRQSRNPRNLDPIWIESRRYVRFKPSRLLLADLKAASG